MIDGLINVSSAFSSTKKKSHFFSLKIWFLQALDYFLSAQMVGTFFIKASTYEFMKFHDLGNAETYFYSFEHYGGPSLWNFLFPGGIPGDPIPRSDLHWLGKLTQHNICNLNFQRSDPWWRVDLSVLCWRLWPHFPRLGDRQGYQQLVGQLCHPRVCTIVHSSKQKHKIHKCVF